MFEFLMLIAGLGLLAYVNQQSGKLKTLTKDVRALKKQLEELERQKSFASSNARSNNGSSWCRRDASRVS